MVMKSCVVRIASGIERFLSDSGDGDRGILGNGAVGVGKDDLNELRF